MTAPYRGQTQTEGCEVSTPSFGVVTSAAWGSGCAGFSVGGVVPGWWYLRLLSPSLDDDSFGKNLQSVSQDSYKNPPPRPHIPTILKE